MSKLEIFSNAGCPYAQRSRMVLIEKGVEFSLTEINLNKKPEGWEKISPYGKVPLLRHDGATIYESAIINEYLDETFPDPPLMPADPVGRAQVRIWMDYCTNRYLPAVAQLRANHADPAKLQQSLEKLKELFLFMEHEGLRKLSSGPYWMGELPTLVDFQFMAFLVRFPCYEEVLGAEIPAECTRLRAWLTAMHERPSVQATSLDTDDYIAAFRKRLKSA